MPQIAAVARGDTGPEVARLKRFLDAYGYMPPESLLQPQASAAETRFDGMLEDAIGRYQRAHGLAETGRLDDVTRRWLNTPRCGVADAVDGMVRAAFAGRGRGFGRRAMTFAADLKHDLPPIDPAVVEREVEIAFAAWGNAGNLRFSPAFPADIFITFRRGDHGDGDPRLVFDGQPGGTLGHAFPHDHSSLGGQVHLDAGEQWSTTLPVTGSADLPMLLLHEIGHALGLEHITSDPTAVMHERFEIGGDRRPIGAADIAAIAEVYPADIT